MSDFFVYFDLVFGKKSIETPHEENEPVEVQDQFRGLRKDPDLNVASLGERFQLNKEEIRG